MTERNVSPAVSTLDGEPLLFSTAFDLRSVGYATEELLCSGVATSCAGATAPFATRLVVYRPLDPDRSNGSAVVEWLNVSGGFDVPALWMTAHRHLVRAGFTWMGVTAQRVGVHGGGGVLPESGLRRSDPDRYGTLTHPGDEFAFDLFTQAGRAVRERFGVERLLATGESQSALYLVSYLNEVAPTARTFDGYLLIGRPGGAAPLDGSFTLVLSEPRVAGAVRIRDDLATPVLVVQSETDLLGRLEYYEARQPDGEHFRLWEVAGSAHCDTYFLLAAALDSGALSADELAFLVLAAEEPLGMPTELPINAGPHMHYVLHAALDHLDRWVQGSSTPPIADRLAVRDDADGPAFVLDEHGNVRGGVRSPWVDVPIATLSGLGQPGDLAQLFGSSLPFDAATLDRLYPGGVVEFGARFDAATNDAVAAGFLLAADAEEIMALGRAMYLARST
jgi:Alpha/beta hydrolase domain